MKTLAKIILASSLMTLAACSGKGSGESRIHGIQTDEGDDPIPTVIDDEDVVPSVEPSDETPSKEEGAKGNMFACQDESGAFCGESTDMSLKSDCNAASGGTLMDKCPAGGKKCDFKYEGITFYAYGITCSDLEMMMTSEWDD